MQSTDESVGHQLQFSKLQAMNKLYNNVSMLLYCYENKKNVKTNKSNFLSQIPPSDPRNGVQSCMPFFRSAPSCGAGLLPHLHREQLNAITSFVDASMVYGSSASLASALRNHSSPLGSMALNSQHSDHELSYMPFLPRQQAHLDPCGPRNTTTFGASGRSAHWENATSCFQAGE